MGERPVKSTAVVMTSFCVRFRTCILSASKVILMPLVHEPAFEITDLNDQMRTSWGEFRNQVEDWGEFSFISLNILSGHFRMWNFFPLPNVLLKTFSNTKKLKEFCNEHPYTHYLFSLIKTLYYTCFITYQLS